MSDTQRMITAAEFEARYLAGSSPSFAEAYRDYRKVVPCGPDHGCDDPTCEGWAMVSMESDRCGECGHYEIHHPVPGCDGFTRERRWPRLTVTVSYRP